MSEEFASPIRRVDPEAIDCSDDTYALSPSWRLPERLLDSIRRVGLLTPLLAEPLPNGRYRLVDGFQRLAAARRLGLETVPLGEAPRAAPLERFVRRLEARLGTRRLDELEQALAAARLSQRFGVPDSELLERHLPLLGVPGRRAQLKRLLGLAALPERLQRALPRLHEEIARKLTAWSEGEQELFLGLLECYRLGVNHQREVFQSLDDLRQSRNEKDPVLAVWRECGAARADSEAARPAAERLAAIRDSIRHARYPTLTAMETEARMLRAALRVPPQVQLQWPRHFEGDRITVGFSFQRPEQLESVARRLAEIARRDELRRLLGLL